ncbi:Porphobilinogen deaminase [Sphingomonas sp. RIT328]|nr:Porphobilinogen deaminase [Sphingomonas sp. RIT328]
MAISAKAGADDAGASMAINFRLGTRGSPLALTQAAMVRDALCAAHGWAAETVALVVIRTTGDRVQDRPLAEIGGKALWTKELDRALLEEEIDAAVHSMKDVETIRPAAIRIAAMLPRADVRDRLIGADTVAALPAGAVVGTSSPRRRAQLLRLRPDLSVVTFRGNVDTRLAKLAAGEAQATLLAAAGLDRLGRDGVGRPIATDDMLPAPAQGAVGIEVRHADHRAALIVAAIDDPATSACVAAERALLAHLGADCHSPVAALAALSGAMLTLRAELIAEDGSAWVEGSGEGTDGALVAAELAADLLARAPAVVRQLFQP